MRRAIEYNKKYTYDDLLKIMSDVCRKAEKQSKHKLVIYAQSVEQAERIRQAIKEFDEHK